MAIPYYHVDAFTGELFAGNPAGVCILPAFLADSIMQKIAAENRHSETAFVVPRAEWSLPCLPYEDHPDHGLALALSRLPHDGWFDQCRELLLTSSRVP